MHRRHLIAAALVVTAACSSDSTGTGGDNNGNNNQYNTATGTMTASIGGASWTANFLTHATYSSGVLSITGESFNGNSEQERVITMAILNVTVDSSYTLSTPGDGHGGNAIMTLGSTQQWYSSSTGGTGTVTITALDANHVAGTFQFVGIGAGGIANATVTDGHFDIPL